MISNKPKPLMPHAGRTRVLVVDDCLDIVRVFAKVLKSAGFEVATARDGFEALGIASEFQPNVMLLDIGLPDIDGFEVASRLRADSKFKATILIAFTAIAADDYRSRAKAVGFDHYLVKPVSFAELLSVLVEGRPDTPLDPMIGHWHHGPIRRRDRDSPASSPAARRASSSGPACRASPTIIHETRV